MKPSFIRKNIQPAILSIVVFVLLLIATITYTNYKQGLWEKDIRSKLMDILVSKKSKLEKSLYSRIYYTRGVAAFVALRPNITSAEFNELAHEYIKKDTVISSMALSPDCILRDIYPLKGHEAAIGLNLLTHPERKGIVEKTIETHQTFVAGPVVLVEGGIAFISYTPIFDKNSSKKNKFWGVTDIVIKEYSLLNEAKYKTSENGYNFALKGYNGTGEKGAVFWGDESVFNKKPVTIHVDLPIGSWILAAVPSAGWNLYPNQDKAISTILFISSFIISVLIWLFSRALLKIRQNEKELTAIFGSMDSLIVEYSSKGEYLKIAPTNKDILYLPPKELLGKTVHEIFDQEKADLILDAIRKCIHDKKLVVIEYPLEINNSEHWFSARINYKTENSVIFNAFDVTERKINEKTIHESEIRLKQLNEMKDKFFSIIAHDLRNPVGNLKVLTHLIADDWSNMDHKQLNELLESLRTTSSSLHLLLEDLLEWSRSQSGNIETKKQKVEMHKLCRKLFNQNKVNADLKNITLVNRVDPKAIVLADSDLTGIVLRNLLSNALKFTNRGGEITLSSEFLSNGNGNLLKINVTDNGIGIQSSKLETLFHIGKTVSSPGTENETGTGLGLLLCKEFTEMQGGHISAVSNFGEGSTFSITLPLAQ